MTMVQSLGRARLPVALVEVELCEPLPGLPPQGPPGTATLLLVRLHGAPVGSLLVEVTNGVGPEELAERIWEEAQAAVTAHFAADGLTPPDGLQAQGCESAPAPRCQRRRQATLDQARSATVVVATRERTEHLRRCLESLRNLDYPSFDVVVVDNDPETDATARLIGEEFTGDIWIRYVRESRRGLAAAHNRGIEVATGEIIAFTDDDVVVDPGWLAALAEGFRAAEGVAAVTGLIHPAELRTEAQLLLEQHGSFGKGFIPKVFDLRDHRPDDPLYPFTAGQLGSGANMAFDAGVLRRLGGFDPAMGTGTTARGGDDLVALFSVIASGHRLAYQPTAVVYHHHRDEMAALERQAYGYGVGLGAYLTNVMIHQPHLALRVAARAPRSFSAALSLNSERNRRRYDCWPDHLARRERRGIALGPVAYTLSRWRARGAARPAPVI